MRRADPRTVVFMFLVALGALSLVAGLLMLMGGCGNPPSVGTVASKKFTPSYTWYSQVCVSYGEYGCQVSMPFPHTEPDAWTICLRRDAQDTGHDETRYRVGDHYPDAR